MGRRSTKKDKNVYQLRREEMGLSREKASQLLEIISADRIEKIESEKCQPQPYEVVRMSDCYKAPNLCNHFCANDCPIGQEYVPEVEMKELSQITLEMLASLNSIEKKKERLIEIVADGKIEENEYDDFALIQNELEKISLAVETLQLWVEKTIDEGAIDVLKLQEARNKYLTKA